jgi:hypothetical protein
MSRTLLKFAVALVLVALIWRVLLGGESEEVAD